MVGDWTTRGSFHSFGEFVENAAPEFEAEIVSSEDNCFLIYTLGTTGLPKGVVHRYPSAERLTAAAKSVLHLEGTILLVYGGRRLGDVALLRDFYAVAFRVSDSGLRGCV